MKREVLLSITGRQTGQGETDQQTSMQEAEYFLKNGSHYLLYEETLDQGAQAQKCRIKLSEGKMELTRKGELSSHMIFEEHKRHLTQYETPFGSFPMCIETKKLEYTNTDAALQIQVEYALEMNGEHIWDCSLQLVAQER